MYSKLPNLIFGFHGCTENTHDAVLIEHLPLEFSVNNYDWLGHGIYFWENSYQKAYDWASKYSEPSVIEHIHNYNKINGYPEYDSVRGVFTEGGSAFEGSGFKSKTHIQLCIRNPNCIKGYFDPLVMNEDYPLP